MPVSRRGPTMGADRDHEGADRHVERVFNPERKDTLWGETETRRKMKRPAGRAG